MLCFQRRAMLTAIVQQNIYAHKYCVELRVLILFKGNHSIVAEVVELWRACRSIRNNLVHWRNHVTCHREPVHRLIVHVSQKQLSSSCPINLVILAEMHVCYNNFGSSFNVEFIFLDGQSKTNQIPAFMNTQIKNQQTNDLVYEHVLSLLTFQQYIKNY